MTISYICKLNDILVEDLVARAVIGAREIAVIDNGSNGVASYALLMAHEVRGEISVVFEEFYGREREALREFALLLVQEAGLDLPDLIEAPTISG